LALGTGTAGNRGDEQCPTDVIPSEVEESAVHGVAKLVCRTVWSRNEQKALPENCENSQNCELQEAA
jgi:hypothetical protein